MIQSPHLNNIAASQVLNHKGVPVKMRSKGNRLYGYSYITDPLTNKVRQIEFSLNAYIWEQNKAIMNLGAALERIERGDYPNYNHLKFKKVAEQWLKNPVSIKGRNHGTSDNLLILTQTLIPYFGEMKIKDVTPESIKTYLTLMESDQRPLSKNSRAKKQTGKKADTLKKELRVLKWVMQSVFKTFELPYWEFKNPAKEKFEAPSFEDVVLMIDALPDQSEKFGKEYQDIAWTMALTGLDVLDVLKLTRTSFINGLLVGKRGKTKKPFKVAVSKKLSAILKKRMVVNISSDEPFFRVPSNAAVAKAILRAFASVGLKQFHAKSLRDFHASILFNAGFPDNFIQQTLGHAPGSTQTRKYTHASDEKLTRAAKTFDSLSLLRKEINQK